MAAPASACLSSCPVAGDGRGHDGALAPILLGSGERLFDNLDRGPTGYECVELVSSPAVTHVRLVRRAADGSG